MIFDKARWCYVKHDERKWFKQVSVYLEKKKKKKIYEMIINVK